MNILCPSWTPSSLRMYSMLHTHPQPPHISSQFMSHAGSRDHFYSCLKDVISSARPQARGDASRRRHHKLVATLGPLLRIHRGFVNAELSGYSKVNQLLCALVSSSVKRGCSSIYSWGLCED